jgi:hypothetical protein
MSGYTVKTLSHVAANLQHAKASLLSLAGNTCRRYWS